MPKTRIASNLGNTPPRMKISRYTYRNSELSSYERHGGNLNGYFLKILFIFRKRARERERERERHHCVRDTSISYLLHASQVKIEPTT